MIGTVLIVDDELHIRNTLRKMIESNDTGWDIIGEASNGREALDIIASMDPDLVITDVRMPLMNGLELAEAIHIEKHSTMVVILTGHKDFGYAQAALRYGVIEFLLKPCSEQEVCSVLSKLYSELAESEMNRLREQCSSEVATIRAWIHHLPYDKEIMHRLQQRWTGATVCMITVEDYFPMNKNYIPSDLLILQFGIENIMQEVVESYDEDARVMLIHHDRFVIFFRNKWQECAGALDGELFKQLENKVMDLLGISILVNYIYRLERLEELVLLFEDTEKLQFSGRSERRQVTNLPLTREYTFNYAKLQTLEDQLMSFIVLGKFEFLQHNFQTILNKIVNLSLDEARLEALGAAITLDTIARKNLEALELEFDLQEGIRVVHQFEHIEGIVDWLGNMMNHFMNVLIEWSGGKTSSVIRNAVAYMERSYMQRCSLQDVAEHIYLNPKYFSMLFKREKGESFVQYLTQLRLKKAEMLLSISELQVTEIANRVGYDDPNYFSTVFRKEFGMSPNEYRKTRKP